MSPGVLRTLLKFRNGQAVSPLDGDTWTWTYGINPLERNALKWFVVLQRWEKEY